jgi:subtilase family serine protease
MIVCKKCVPVVVAFLCVFFASWAGSAQQRRANDQVRSALRVQGQSHASDVGLTPAQIRRAYGFDRIENGGRGQVIAIVVPFDHPRIEQDLARFSRAFDLPECEFEDHCLRKIYASGERPDVDPIWALEAALGVEWAHAIAPEARILLVEADSDKLSDLLPAIDVAVRRGADVVSMSWGIPEFAGELANDNHFVAHGVMFVAASGDSGTGGLYPAASPFVVGVGGTTLNIDRRGNYLGEVAWAGSGGGQSAFETAPSYQFNFPIPNNPQLRRGIPDVAYNADPETAFAVFTSVELFGFKGWFGVGGTSVAAPQWAGLLAIANSSRAERRKGPLRGSPGVLYDVAKPGIFNDIASGQNGSCGSLCTAVPGYDYVTGLGSPRANHLIAALVNRP